VSRRWLVTGASGGIGSAIARAAAAGGARVALVARGEQVEALAASLPGAVAVRADVVADAEAIVARACDALGGLDVLVNNAGLHRGGRIEKLDPEDFDAAVDVNLRAPFRLCRAAAVRMEAGSAIVNVGSVVGFRGFPGDAPYAASKMGAVGLTYVLAMELARRGITANVVVPGFVETAMTAGLSDRARESLVERIPLGRPAAPEEVAQVVAWVAASTYMTGAVVPVDGGLMAALGSR
jgi:3-oxoacyl-[acyl-carrier protein] reductase